MVAMTSRLRSQLAGSKWPVWGTAIWIPLAAAMATLALLVYAAVQQDIRQSANEPQVSLAEAAAARLRTGQSPASTLPGETVDMRTSLAPFMIVYDRSGKILASSTSLDGRTPDLPAGVLASIDRCARVANPVSTALGIVSARLHGERPCGMPGAIVQPGETRFTWQPAAGVRAAVVVTSYGGASPGYVLAGRSLRETELLEDHIFFVVGWGLAFGLAATFVAAFGSAALVGALRR
jgi:hypothetical protein